MSQISPAQLIGPKFSDHLHPVVPINNGKFKVAGLNLSPSNKNFTEAIYTDSDLFNAFIENEKKKDGAQYLMGGYGEERNMYLRSSLFDDNAGQQLNLTDEPRNIHLGIDIWADAGTPVMAPLGGMVHSIADNKGLGNYGPTIILQHQVDTFNFYTLYGHLSRKDLQPLRIGQFITRGETFAHFGKEEENGNWPPHLHFQVIIEINEWVGDYPGVCKKSEIGKYMANSPDPDLLLQMRDKIGK